MARVVALDSGPLGMIAHPRPNREIATWFQQLLASGTVVILPEIADYEVRRSLLLENLTESIERLDKLKEALTYLPLTTQAMLKAAEFWATARKQGQQTAHDKALDADMILAAQASLVADNGNKVVIATTNVKHLSLFASASEWWKI